MTMIDLAAMNDLPANVDASVNFTAGCHFVTTYRNNGTDTDAPTYSCTAIVNPPNHDGAGWSVAFGFTHAGGSIDGQHDRFVVARPTRLYKTETAARRAGIRWANERR